MLLFVLNMDFPCISSANCRNTYGLHCPSVHPSRCSTIATEQAYNRAVFVKR